MLGSGALGRGHHLLAAATTFPCASSGTSACGECVPCGVDEGARAILSELSRAADPTTWT